MAAPADGESMNAAMRRAAEFAANRSLDHDWNSLGEFGVALNGLLAVDDGTLSDTIDELVDRSIRTQTSTEQLCHDFVCSGSWDDVVTSWTGTEGFTSTIGAPLVGQAVLNYLDRAGESRYKIAVLRQYEALESVERTADGASPHAVSDPSFGSMRYSWSRHS